MHLFPYMLAYKHNFCTKDSNHGHVTQENGVEFKFEQSSHVSYHDRNLIGDMLGYTGKIQDTTQVKLSSFQCVIFR